MHFPRNIFATALVAVCLSSCSSVFQYGPGNLGHESRLLLTPGNKDSLRTAHNLSGRYTFNLGDGYNPDESCRFGEAYYHLGYSAKYLSCALGTGLFGGSYKVRKFTIDPGWKNFFGLNGLGQAAVNLPIGPFNWRILGVRAGFSAEQGALYDFRRKYRNTPGFDELTDNRLTFFTGTYSEIMYSKNACQFGISGSNTVMFERSGLLGFAASYCMYAGYKDVNLVYQITGGIRQGQNHSLGVVLMFR